MNETPGCIIDMDDMLGVVVRVENGPQILFVDLDGNSSIGELLDCDRLKDCDLYFGDFLIEGSKALIHKISVIEKNYHVVQAKYAKNGKCKRKNKANMNLCAYDPSKKCLITLLGAHGKYLCAEPNGNAVCNRGAANKWEQFWSIPVGKNKVGLLGCHKKHLCANSNGSLVANRGHLKAWETFEVVTKNGRYGFKSCHNKYVSAQPDGRIEANRNHLQEWELFEVGVIKSEEQKLNDAQNGKVLADGEYLFVAAHSNKVLDVEGGSMNGGAKLIQWDAHKGKNQQFVVKRQQSGCYTVQCKHSGMFWDICEGSTANKAKLIQWPYHGGNNQLFEFVHRGDGKWVIKAKHSGKVLDVEGGHKHGGAKVQQFGAHYGANQLFYCKQIQ